MPPAYPFLGIFKKIIQLVFCNVGFFSTLAYDKYKRLPYKISLKSPYTSEDIKRYIQKEPGLQFPITNLIHVSYS